MRSSTLALLVVAASVPAFSAPLSTTVFSRDAPTSQVDTQDQSGAINFGGIISGLANLFFNKREDADLLARDDDLLQREYVDLLTREATNAQADPESGALNIPGLINTFSGLFDAFFNKREDFELLARSLANDNILKREYYELLARADPSPPTDESGALNIPGIINTFGGFFDAFFNKREELELFARSLAANEDMLKREYADILARADPSAPVDESGALNIPGLVNTFSGLFDAFFNKREDFELFARSIANDDILKREYSDLLSRADPSAPGDESGALNIPGLINTFSGLFNAFFNKREDFELLSRSLASDDLFVREYSELLARADPSASVDESGAINFGKIVDTVGGLINAFFNKREEFELLARGLAADDGVLKREFVELLSRADSSAPSDESGAINFGKIIDTVGGLIGAFFNKREELDMMAREFEARSLNELD